MVNSNKAEDGNTFVSMQSSVCVALRSPAQSPSWYGACHTVRDVSVCLKRKSRQVIQFWRLYKKEKRKCSFEKFKNLSVGAVAS